MATAKNTIGLLVGAFFIVSLGLVIYVEKALGASTLSECSGTDTDTWNTCYGKIVRDDGTYIGQWEDGTPHGRGIILLPDGDVYTGNVRNGAMHGHGIYSFVNGPSYVGEFKDGMFSGMGTFTVPNKLKYVGEFENDDFNATDQRVLL